MNQLVIEELNKSAKRVVLNKVVKKPKNYRKATGIITEFDGLEAGSSFVID